MNLEKFAMVLSQLCLPTDKILKAGLLMQPTIEVNNFVYLRELKKKAAFVRGALDFPSSGITFRVTRLNLGMAS